MATKPFRKTIVTPVGTAIYPHLTAPDAKFGDPVYKCNLRLTGEDATQFIAKIEEMKVQAMEHLGVKDLIVPIVPALDDDKQPIPGAFDVKTKAKAFFKQADGSMVENNLTIVDSQKNPYDAANGAIWGGSKVKLALNVGAVSTAVYSGLMLRITACQVIDLVTGGQGGANSFDVEDGYEAESKPVAKVAEGEDETIDF
jgi:hypothetical protein